MLFLYGELMVLLFVSFGLGAAAAALVTRRLVKAMPPELTGRTGADGSVVADGGGTP